MTPLEPGPPEAERSTGVSLACWIETLNCTTVVRGRLGNEEGAGIWNEELRGPTDTSFELANLALSIFSSPSDPGRRWD